MKKKIIIVSLVALLVTASIGGYLLYQEHQYQSYVTGIETTIRSGQFTDVKSTLEKKAFTLREVSINQLVDTLVVEGINKRFTSDKVYLHNYYQLFDEYITETMRGRLSKAIVDRLMMLESYEQVELALANDIFDNEVIRANVFREDYQESLFTHLAQVGNQSVIVLYDYLASLGYYKKSELVEHVLLEYKVIEEARESYYKPFSNKYKDRQIASLARNDYFKGEFLQVIQYDDVLYFCNRLSKWTYEKNDDLMAIQLKGVALGMNYYAVETLDEGERDLYKGTFNQLINEYYQVQIEENCNRLESRLDILETDQGNFSDFEPFTFGHFYQGEKTVVHAKGMTLILENKMPWSFMIGFEDQPMNLYGIVTAGEFYHVSQASEDMIEKAENAFSIALEKCDQLKMMGFFAFGNPSISQEIPLSKLITWTDWKVYIDEQLKEDNFLNHVSDELYAVKDDSYYYKYKFGEEYGNVYWGKYQTGTIYGTEERDAGFIYLDTYSFKLDQPILAYRETIKDLFDDQVTNGDIPSIQAFIIEKIYYELDGSYDNHTAAKALDKGLGVCESYAGLYNQMLNYSGIENYYLLVKSPNKTTSSHAYNVVLNHGDRVFTDLTWADAETYVDEKYLSFALSEHEYKPYQLPYLKLLIGDY